MAEVIVTGGEKVWPAPVEDVLAAHPGVAEVAVWKRPDPEWGERVVAWVVPADRRAAPRARRAPRAGGRPGWPGGPRPASWWWSAPCPGHRAARSAGRADLTVDRTGDPAPV